MKRLVILRPEPGASESVERARHLGLEAEAVPLFAIEPIEWQAPDVSAFDALLLTSANAPRHGGPKLAWLSALPVYAVGGATAAAAHAAGFRVADVGEGGVERLLMAIPPHLRLLHLCGEVRRDISDPARRITALPVYRASPVAVDSLARTVCGAVVAVHSPRAGARLAELVPEAERQTVRIATISPAAAEAAGDGWELVESTPEPTDSALLALAARLCNNGGEP